MLRIAALWLALAPSVALLTACGTSGVVPSDGGTQSVTSGEALAFADAVNLRASDVRGLVAKKPVVETTTMPGPLGLAVETCDGSTVSSADAIRVPSNRFKHSLERSDGALSLFPIESVQSVVYVLGSPAGAKHELASIRSARGRECLKNALTAGSARAIGGGSVEAEGRKAKPFFGQIKVTALPAPVRGVPSYWLRWRACESLFFPSCTRGRSEQTEDYLGFVVGPAW